MKLSRKIAGVDVGKNFRAQQCRDTVAVGYYG